MNGFVKYQRVSMFIARRSAAGLLGRTDTGVRAIIREREVSWDPHVSLDMYVNQTREAMIIGYDPVQDQLELSLRLVDRDPWSDIETKYPVGSEIQGRVVGLIREAAFVELEPGVDAFLPIAELRQLPDRRIEEILWLQDSIKGMVTEVLPAQRRLRINLRELVAKQENLARRRLWAIANSDTNNGVTLAEILPTDIRHRLLQIGITQREPDRAERVRVLLVEDDDVFAAGMSSMLQSNQCDVTLAKDSLSAIELVHEEQSPFDLILLDWNLPAAKGHELAKELQANVPSSRIVMMLDLGYLRQNPELQELISKGDIDVISKSDTEGVSLGTLSILREVRNARADPHAELHRQRPSPHDIGSGTASALPSSSEQGAASESSQLSSILHTLRIQTNSSWVGVMHLDAGHLIPSVDCFDGPRIVFEDAPPDIMYSPLQNVLGKAEEVWSKADHKSPGFDRLLELHSFRGFLGVPLAVAEGGGYGLIMLKNDREFPYPEVREARLTALLVAQVLREKRLMQTFRPWQAQNLAGQLVDSIVHEVNNKLAGIELLVRSLQQAISELSRSPEKADDPTFLHGLEAKLQKVKDAQTAASKLRDWYLGVSATDHPQSLDLGAFASEMIRATRSQAQGDNIILSLKCMDGVPRVVARPSQLQQIFLNLMLNAMQQMARIQRIGEVSIEISYHPEFSPPVQVRFVDSGPGIHRQLWGRVFEFGFTTKEQGAGLGLTISRAIAADLGGALRVESSYMLLGTTFLLELPKGG